MSKRRTAWRKAPLHTGSHRLFQAVRAALEAAPSPRPSPPPGKREGGLGDPHSWRVSSRSFRRTTASARFPT